MADTYSITVNMTDSTLQGLGEETDQLRGYKGVKSSMGGGKSTVWFATTDFANTVTIKWEEQYVGYISNHVDLQGGVAIDASSAKEMELGDVLTAASDGSSVVTTTGTAGAISIANPNDKPWICGMGEMVNGTPSIMCAFPLHGNHDDTMMPYEQVLLVFESEQVDTGTVVEEAISSAIIITLTGEERTRKVNYDIDKGWDAAGAKWAELVSGSLKLADKLIHNM